VYTIMVKGVKGKKVRGGFPTVVDYSIPIEILLKGRCYDRIVKEINSENFPSRESGKTQIVAKPVQIRCRPVFDSPGFMNELNRLEDRGYELADLRESLTVLNNHKSIHALPAILIIGSTISIDSDLLSPMILEHCCCGSSVGLEKV
jgi:hypothetical protein